MSITKGDILYRKADGQPIPVLRTRKLQDGITRLYLGHPVRGRQADVYWGELGEYSDYSLTQTPELAQLWANTLKEYAERHAEQKAKWEAQRVFALANRDALNAPEIVGEPWDDELRVLFGVQSVELGSDALSLETREHFHEVMVANSYRWMIDEAGEIGYTHACGVNWSTLGPQSPAVARAYARAILAAADLAESRPLTPTEELTR